MVLTGCCEHFSPTYSCSILPVYSFALLGAFPYRSLQLYISVTRKFSNSEGAWRMPKVASWESKGNQPALNPCFCRGHIAGLFWRIMKNHLIILCAYRALFQGKLVALGETGPVKKNSHKWRFFSLRSSWLVNLPLPPTVTSAEIAPAL